MTVPDYVFDKYFENIIEKNNSYKMMNLSELENYLKLNKHLPRVPSRKEIEKDGVINLQGISMITLEKTEENTLYILELKNEIEKLKTENNILKSKNEKLEFNNNEILLKLNKIEYRINKIESK